MAQQRRITNRIHMRNIAGIVVLMVITSGTHVMAQSKPDSWSLFARTKFEPKYYEKAQEYLLHPDFPAELTTFEGKELVLEGYYVPFAPEGGGYIILSKYPMSQCFFCGGGGPESIAEVNFVKAQSKFEVDDLLTVKGKLRLNSDDMDHINFILDDAVLLKR